MKLSLFYWNNLQGTLRGCQLLRRTVHVGTVALVLGLGGCRFINVAPNDADALVAVRAVMGEAGMQLPQSFQLKQVHILSCVWQDSPDGHVCNVTLVSSEVPIIGAVTVPMSFRFARRDGQLKAFLM